MDVLAMMQMQPMSRVCDHDSVHHKSLASMQYAYMTSLDLTGALASCICIQSQLYCKGGALVAGVAPRRAIDAHAGGSPLCRQVDGGLGPRCVRSCILRLGFHWFKS